MSSRVLTLSTLALALAGAPVIVAAPATAASTTLVVAEVYGGGGNSGATYDADFVELRNLGATEASLDGLSLQYRSASGAAQGSLALAGSVAPGARYLVQASAAGATGQPLPTPDLSAQLNLSSTNGSVELRDATSVVDLVGYGETATVFEGARTGVELSSTLSAQRFEGAPDTDDNAADFTEAAPTPDAAGPDLPPAYAIAEIQGTGDTSPLAGETVRTQGRVTARYPSGGLRGFYVQTGGAPATPGASDGLFVYAPDLDAADVPFLGDSVEVSGEVSEYQGTTELTLVGVPAPVRPALPAVVPLSVPWSELDTDAEKEAHEGELLAPAGPFTVTDSYDTDRFGEIGLAAGTTPLRQPTDVADAQGDDDEAVAADNELRRIILDDGASLDFRAAENLDSPMSWLTTATPVRAGAPVTFTGPVVLESRFEQWRLQPVRRITGAGSATATFADTRTAAPAAVGGDVRIATFNVLNFFPTTGEAFEAAAPGNSCTYFRDRDGAPTTVDDCVPNGPRGAADAANLARQRSKIVTAINRLGAGVVSLEEIENAARLGQDRDAALQALVAALNAAAGAGTWAFVPSPPAAELPPLAEQDVIRTAFIYKPREVALVGASRVLTGSPAFAEAREPLAQAFKRVGATDASAFTVVVNHFKSKSSGTADPDGQGAGNDQRIAQAEALESFAAEFAADRGTAAVFLAGDFNAYTQEDPIQVLTGAGYTALESTTSPGETSYYFDGLAGSLDHVLANPAALALVTGVDIWGINAEEPVATEYSRYNGNVTLLYEGGTPYRASDHNPEIVGLRLPLPAGPTVSGPGPAPVPAPATSTTTAALVGKAPRVGGRKARVLVSVTSATAPTGTVTVKARGQQPKTLTLSGGTATLRLGRFDRPGTVKVKVTYAGTAGVLASSDTLRFRVRR